MINNFHKFIGLCWLSLRFKGQKNMRSFLPKHDVVFGNVNCEGWDLG